MPQPKDAARRLSLKIRTREMILSLENVISPVKIKYDDEDDF